MSDTVFQDPETGSYYREDGRRGFACQACGNGYATADALNVHACEWQDDYTAPGVELYWTDDRGSASALLLLAGLIPLAFVVWFLAHVAGAVATVGGVQ